MKRGSKILLGRLKSGIAALDQEKSKGIRVSSSGCLGRCKEGPVLVVYPNGLWFRCETQQDIDEFIEKHVLQKQAVAGLLLPDD